MTSRENVKHNTRSFLLNEHKNGKITLIFFAVSVILHILLFAGAVFFPDLKRPKPVPQVIQIDLVSFAPVPSLEASPSQTPTEPEPEPQVEQDDQGVSIKAASKPEKKTIQHKKPDISLKTKPKNLKKLIDQKKRKPVEKKKKPKPEKAEQKAEKKETPPPPENKNEKTEPEPVDEEQQRIADALRRLQEKVKSQGADTSKGMSGQLGKYKKGTKPMDLYKIVIGSTIEQNWVFNDVLAQMDQNLEVRLLIKILKSGEIRDIIYETRSGNRYLDESAKKAIKKANPLPALPPGRPSWDVIVIFTPKGLK